MADLLIDGRWVAAAEGRTREIRCPADGTLVAVVDEAGHHGFFGEFNHGVVEDDGGAVVGGGVEAVVGGVVRELERSAVERDVRSGGDYPAVSGLDGIFKNQLGRAAA